MAHEQELWLASLALLERVLQRSRNPAVLCSFGKDSMVALHMARRVMPNIPVVFWRDPWVPLKHVFANRMILDWELVVHECPPSGTEVMAREDGGVEIVNHHDLGGGKTCMRPTGTYKPAVDEPMICGLKDMFQRPRARHDFKWDMLVHGQRHVDKDPTWGALPLGSDVGLQAEAASFVFPLRHWTDADIWAYTDFHVVPQNYDRYRAQPDGTYLDEPSKRWNSDYMPACTSCMKPGGSPVWCPRLGVDVSNCAAQLPWRKPQQFSYS